MKAARAGTIAVLAVVGVVGVLPARRAEACGAFISRTVTARYNDALEFVVVRDGTRTEVSVQNRYRGPVEDFALLIPVPVVLQDGDVQVLPHDVFDRIEAATAPVLYDLVQKDPCRDPDEEGDSKGATAGGNPNGVNVESEFVVGEYQVVVLSATEATALDGWLSANDYKMPDGMAPLLRPYVEDGSKFFVARVDPTKVKFVDGVAQLSPLRFAYDWDEIRLPLRLSTLNSAGAQDVIVHVIARGQRYHAANRPNATIPTGLVITREAGDAFGAFYGTLFDRVLAEHPGAVVTEHARPAYGLQDVLPKLGAAVTTERPDWVISRLHLRIHKDGPLDDLVLRAAQPIVGGDIWSSSREAEHDIENDFRAVYQTRVPWPGAVDCSKTWERWRTVQLGDQSIDFAAKPSTVALETLVAEDVPSLKVKATHPLKKAAAGKGGKSGCGCASGGGGGGGGALALLVVALLWRRRGGQVAPSTARRASHSSRSESSERPWR